MRRTGKWEASQSQASRYFTGGWGVSVGFFRWVRFGFLFFLHVDHLDVIDLRLALFALSINISVVIKHSGLLLIHHSFFRLLNCNTAELSVAHHMELLVLISVSRSHLPA